VRHAANNVAVRTHRRIVLVASEQQRDLAFRRRVVGWQGGAMCVIYEVLLGLVVLRSGRDRLPFGDVQQHAGTTDSSDG